jgi:hypothetical protein
MANNGKYTALIILVAFYLLIRVLILFGSIDKVHLDEELFRGNIAKELVSGPILPFFDYQRSEYEGGSLLAGLTAVPFFLLFGENLLSLKLAALSFSVLALILWYLFLDKFFHRRAAVLAGLLWIFSPPFFTKWGLFHHGSYSETNFFIIITTFIFYEIFFVKERRWLYAALGLASGFALFVHFYFIMALSAILLFWFIFDKKFVFRKTFFIFVTFALLGLSPWIYYNLSHGFEGFIVADKPMFYWFTQNNLWDSLLRFKHLVVWQFADSFGFQDIGFINRSFSSNTYYLLFIFSFCGLLFINRKALLKVAAGVIPYRRFAVTPKETPPEIPLIVFFLVFSVIFSVSGFKLWANFYYGYVTRYRYLIPFYPFIFALTAVFYHRMAEARQPVIRRLSLYPALISLFLCSIANLNLISPENVGKNFLCTIYKGYNYYDLGKIICWRFDDAAKYIKSAERIKDADNRMFCYAGMGWGFAKEKFNDDYGFYIHRVLPALDKKYWPEACERVGTVTGYNDVLVKELNDNMDIRYLPYFYRGFGVEAGKRLICDRKEYARLAQLVDAQYAPYFHEGMGMELGEVLFNDTDGFIRFTNAVNEKFRPYIYKGLAEGRVYYQFKYDKFGFGIGKVGYNIKAWNEIINKIDDEYKPYCYQRLGIEIGWRFIHDIKKYRLFLEQVDTRYLSVLYKGIGMGIGWRFGYDIVGCVQLIKEMNQKYWPFIYEGLGEGVLKHYGFLTDSLAKRAEVITLDYRRYFSKGLNGVRAK